jgi:hypothetical protein
MPAFLVCSSVCSPFGGGKIKNYSIITIIIIKNALTCSKISGDTFGRPSSAHYPQLAFGGIFFIFFFNSEILSSTTIGAKGMN